MSLCLNLFHSPFLGLSALDMQTYSTWCDILLLHYSVYLLIILFLSFFLKKKWVSYSWLLQHAKHQKYKTFFALRKMEGLKQMSGIKTYLQNSKSSLQEILQISALHSNVLPQEKWNL